MSAPTLYSCGVVKDIDDKDVDLSSFKGKIVCVVNVATE
jgi:glutathione peroxidase-family protein